MRARRRREQKLDPRRRAGCRAVVGIENDCRVGFGIGGKHTRQSQFVAVQTRAHTVVLASDNMYLYENLDTHTAIAQTLDAVSNLRTQDRMRSLAK